MNDLTSIDYKSMDIEDLSGHVESNWSTLKSQFSVESNTETVREFERALRALLAKIPVTTR